MSAALRSRLAMMCVLRRESTVGAYVRRAIEQSIERDMRDYPSARLIARPGEVLYKMEGEGKSAKFIPITKTLGGERVWVLGNVGLMPHAMSLRYGYMADLTVEPGQQGTEARNVIISAEGVIGDAERPTNPPSTHAEP